MSYDCNTFYKAKDAISKFFSESYPDMVKNPVLLLNYLYQHSYISRPIYTVIFERRNPPYHIVACFVNERRTIGTGTSKKAARTKSAQLMLSLIQNCSENSSDTTTGKYHSHSDPVESDLQNYSQMPDDIIMTQCGAELSFHHRAEYFSSSSSDSPSDIVLQPQCDLNETVLAHGSSLKRSISCTETRKAEDIMENYSEHDNETSNSANVNDEILSTDFDPYFHKNNSSQSSTSSTNSDIENIHPNEELSKATNREVSSKAPTNELKISSNNNNRSKKEAKRPKLSHNVSPTYLLDSYFDPFFRLKPTSKNCKDGSFSRSSIITKVKEVREEPEIIKYDKSSVEGEIPKTEKMKSPFAILQEKSIKNFKLIPRCTIEKDGEGFKCKLVLDSFSSEGAGQSKKLAKINAAIALLKQLDERS